LLNILGCIDRPSSGSYKVRGEEVVDARRRRALDLRSRHIGFVFQSYNLIPQLNVLENILVPLFYQDDPPPTARSARARSRARRPREPARTQADGALGRSTAARRDRARVDQRSGDRAGRRSDRKPRFEDGARDPRAVRRAARRRKTILLVTHEPTIGARAEKTLKLRDGRIEEVRLNRSGAVA
jgi:putative ABC transport system ATP-binding protein